ncbi:hypothetical protein OEZ85_002123 [Tetradesmus obliquus]|uniref:Domain of unknown function at the cortex 1 domain-containing protein n=1 Tax=Tetradesmus obliquus TaxID=3088 RepID=A0ABY8U2Z4_TETOB|nr:hypothetical protein OEZ85_002123 [Tetradesmus obliquus]
MLLCVAQGTWAMQERCASADLVLGSGRVAPASDIDAAAVSATGLVMIQNPTVSLSGLGGGAAARSGASPATFSYGAPEENSFSSAVGHGTWSVTKQGSKVYITLKIKFASAVTMDDLVYGSEFKAPLDLSAATKKVLDAAVAACKRVLGSGVEVDVSGGTPSVWAPLINAAMRVQVSKEAPAGAGPAIAHDMSLYDTTRKPLSFYRRAANRAGKSFTPGDWWTFVVEEKHNLSLYQLWFAKWLNLQSILADQPIQYAVKDKASSEYVLSMDLWTASLAKGYAARYCSV